MDSFNQRWLVPCSNFHRELRVTKIIQVSFFSTGTVSPRAPSVPADSLGLDLGMWVKQPSLDTCMQMTHVYIHLKVSFNKKKMCLLHET